MKRRRATRCRLISVAARHSEALLQPDRSPEKGPMTPTRIRTWPTLLIAVIALALAHPAQAVPPVGTVITETNVSSASALRSSLVPGGGRLKVSKPGTSHTRLILVLVAVGAAAGAGYYFATHKSTPTATISIGAPSVGAPR